jgi:signal transduction histidine kinase/ligand-binding sensor domain-containing protein/DNA-binding response OmpR family regulator
MKNNPKKTPLHLYTTLLILLLCFSIYGKLNAQTESFYFDRYTTENGLLTNQIHCIYQDSKGYIWIGTNLGLVRYNGYSFTTFKHLNNYEGSIGKGSVWAIYEDKQSGLWIGTQGGGLNLFNRDNETFTHYYKNNKPGTSVNDNYINAICSDSFNNVWIGTGYGGLNCYNPKTKTFTYFKNNPSDSLSIGSNGIMSVFFDKQQNLWVGTWGGGLNLFNYRTREFIRYLFDKQTNTIEPKNVVWSIYQDKHNNLWLGTWGSGLLLFNETTRIFKAYKHDNANRSSLANNVVLSMVEDNYGHFWVGTESELNLMDINTEKFTVPKMQGTGVQENLNGASIYSLFNDKQGIVWMGTFGQGVNVWDKSKKKFILQNQFGDVTSKGVNCAFEDETGIIWLGTGANGIVKYDSKLGSNETLKNQKSNFIWNICNLDKDNLLASTFEGLYKVNKQTGNMGNFKGHSKTSNANLFNYKDQYIFIDDKQTLVRYDIKDDLSKVICKTDTLPKISCFIVDKELTIWMGSGDSGVYRYNPDNNSMVNYSDNPKSSVQISDNTINNLYEDKNGDIWIATSNKLNRLNPKILSVKIYDENDGLDNSNVFYITDDDNGNTWVSTANGLSKLDAKTNKFINYYELDGLPDKTPRLFRGRKDEIIMTGVKGFSIFNPAKIDQNMYIPPVVFTDFKLFNKPVGIGVKGSPLKKHISETKEIELSYKQTVLTFGWVGLNYQLPEKNQYAYKMEGFDKDWNYVGAIRTATYTNLNPGTYVFRVKVANNDGIWNEQGASLKITVLPPFWMTWWFRFLVAVFITGAFYTWFRIHIWRLQAQKTILQKLVVQRTSDINRQNEQLQKQKEELSIQADGLQEANFLLTGRKEELEAATEELKSQGEELYRANAELLRINSMKDRLISIIAHDLKNPFNAIIGFTEYLTEKFTQLANEKKMQILDNVLLSSKGAYKLLEDLLEWARSQNNTIELRPESISIKPIALKVKQIIDLQAGAKNITIDIDFQDELVAYADASMVETIIRNFVSNAVKFTPLNGKVLISGTRSVSLNLQGHTISLTLSGSGHYPTANFVRISVSDTGIGIAPEVLQQLFRIDVPHKMQGTAGEGGTGLGLILCHEFAEKNFGKIVVESQIEKGSTFSLYLPEDKNSADQVQKTRHPLVQPEEINEDPDITGSILLDSKGEKYHILVVEDNTELRNYLIKSLETGFQVDEAKNGKIGIEKAFQSIPDLIISDVMMPETDGFELCKTVKSDERTSHIPVILLTAKMGDENHIHGLETGADDYLMKPFNIHLLKIKIKNMLEMQQRLRERYGSQLFIGPSDLPVSNVDENFIKRAIEIVENNISNVAFSVDGLSYGLKMSRFQFYRKLNALANTSPADFIRTIRLKRAAQLLIQGELNISQICYETGFNDHSYFTKCFKKEFGVLPKDYVQNQAQD